MSSGLVLVIDDDEWVSRLLAAAIRNAGYDAVTCGTAKAGLETACAVEPDCIVCDMDLPDADGFWVARALRTQPSRVSVTPFLFLSALDDQESRLEGFHVGADVYMTKPFRVDEVVAQVAALVQMATRLRARRESFLSIPPSEANAIEGDLGQMSIATVLTILEMERRSGTFEVNSKKRKAQLELASGCIVQGAVGGTKVSALGALRTMLGWKVGRFSFAPSEPRDPPASQKSIGALLMEAVRLEDEGARGELDMPAPSVRSPQAKLAAPALGGPSGADDVAPPSTRLPRPSAVPSGHMPILEAPPSSRPLTPITVPPDSDIPISVEAPGSAPAGARPAMPTPPMGTAPAVRGASPAAPPPAPPGPPRPGPPAAPRAAPPAPPRPVPRVAPKPDPAKK